MKEKSNLSVIEKLRLKKKLIKMIITISLGVLILTSFFSLLMPGITQGVASFSMMELTFGGGELGFTTNIYLSLAYFGIVLAVFFLFMFRGSNLRYIIASVILVACSIMFFLTIPLTMNVQQIGGEMSNYNLGGGAIFAGILAIICAILMISFFILDLKFLKEDI